LKWINGTSLRAFFRKQAIKWSLVSLGLTLAIAVPSFLLIVKSGAEKRLLGVAEATTLAFREAIVKGGEKEAQTQMIEAVMAKAPNFVILRDVNLKPFYNDGSIAPQPCPPSQSVCWLNSFHQIEHLEPIYFGDDHKEIYGYADFRLIPVYDHSLIFLFLLLILGVFALQAIGLSTAFDNVNTAIKLRLHDWTEQIRKPTNGFFARDRVPFEEFNETQKAINGLRAEIVKLQNVAIDEARTKLQLEILEEVGHDLRTPINQVEKYFAVLVASTKRTGVMTDERVQSVERTLARVKMVSDQVKELRRDLSQETQTCSIGELSQVLFNDMKLEPEVTTRNINLNFKADSKHTISRVAPVAFQRIFENLVRNAVDAVPNGGIVDISIEDDKGRSTLVVKDNGAGIPDDKKPEIFNFTFTTKGTRGTGLGLGIIKRLCNIYEAEIGFSSLEKQGSTFRVAFRNEIESGVRV
jgi:signal transduction histidine kinase